MSIRQVIYKRVMRPNNFTLDGFFLKNNIMVRPMNKKMSFEDFHRWLKKECKEPREKTKTLGRTKSFKSTISNDGRSLTIEFGSKGHSRIAENPRQARQAS